MNVMQSVSETHAGITTGLYEVEDENKPSRPPLSQSQAGSTVSVNLERALW